MCSYARTNHYIYSCLTLLRNVITPPVFLYCNASRDSVYTSRGRHAAAAAHIVSAKEKEKSAQEKEGEGRQARSEYFILYVFLRRVSPLAVPCALHLSHAVGCGILLFFFLPHRLHRTLRWSTRMAAYRSGVTTSFAGPRRWRRLSCIAATLLLQNIDLSAVQETEESAGEEQSAAEPQAEGETAPAHPQVSPVPEGSNLVSGAEARGEDVTTPTEPQVQDVTMADTEPEGEKVIEEQVSASLYTCARGKSRMIYHRRLQ